MLNEKRNSFYFSFTEHQFYGINKSKFSYYTRGKCLFYVDAVLKNYLKEFFTLKNNAVHKPFQKSENVLMGIEFSIRINIFDYMLFRFPFSKIWKCSSVNYLFSAHILKNLKLLLHCHSTVYLEYCYFDQWERWIIEWNYRFL